MPARRAVDRTAAPRRPSGGRPTPRRRPLAAREAAVVETAPPETASPETTPPEPAATAEADAEASAQTTTGDSRLDDLRHAVAGLRTRAKNVDVDRAMLTTGAVLLPLGLVAIGLGWYGASRSPYEFEQIPYLISGGMLGVGFVIVGGFLYFGYWLTRIFHEQRAQGERLVAAVDRLEARLAGDADRPRTGNGAARGGASTQRAGGAFVATPSGTMFHRPDCAVVADRSGLRTVAAGQRGFEPCAICDPLAAD